MTATPADVARQAEKWTDEQLDCRNEKHRFTVPVTVVHNTLYDYIHEVMACVGNCGVLRRRQMTPDGEVFWGPYHDYSQAKEYLMPPGVGRISGSAKNEVRRQKILRSSVLTKSRKNEPPKRKR